MMKKIYICLIVLFILITIVNGGEEDCSIVFKGGFELSWSFDSSQNVIRLHCAAPAVGWVAIGWHNPDGDAYSGMEEADFVVGIFEREIIPSQPDNVNVRVLDLTTKHSPWPRNTTNEGPGYDPFCSIRDALSAPLVDEQVSIIDPNTNHSLRGQQNVVGLSGQQTSIERGGMRDLSEFTFMRMLSTGDSVGDWPISLDKTMRVVYAWGKSNHWPCSHGPIQRGTSLVNFASDRCTHRFLPDEDGQHVDPRVRYWHGMLMFVAFGVLIPMGVFIARYVKGLWRWWMPLHWVMQITAIMLCLSAFVLIVVFVQNDQNSSQGGVGHFSNPHAILGLVVVIGAMITPVFGLLSHWLFVPNRRQSPIFPNRLHQWLGRITLLAAWVAIVLGVRQLGLDEAATFCLSGLWICFACVFVFVEIARAFRPDRDHIYLKTLESEPLTDYAKELQVSHQ